MEEAVLKYIIRPLIAVVGIYIVGSFIAAAIGIAGAVIALFIAVGGIYFVAQFYKGR